jgi:hypothetical protein
MSVGTRTETQLASMTPSIPGSVVSEIDLPEGGSVQGLS